MVAVTLCCCYEVKNFSHTPHRLM